MINENGSISIHTENLLPIIKKWLYSDKDIFIRELISNSCDAINKLKGLANMGEANVPEDTKFRVDISIDKDKNTLTFTDNGIGMTAEEVKKYINQVAFSGAEDFLAKYKDKLDENNQIIGHFGLGFYSAFMVADKVEINTLSYLENSEAVTWECDGGTEYKLSPSTKTTRGTEITLFIGEDSKDFLDDFKVKEIIKKYCAFMPFEIYLNNEETALNDTTPLWVKKPSECTDEEYKEFYHKLFSDFNDPLFWIHLNVDYPFNLKGILYFPKIKNQFEINEGQIKMYNNQVFVADNIKEIIPEFLLLLKGSLDFKDLPLNVSRSFLQNDGTVNKISKHITKKIADKLNQLYKNEKDNYEKFWDDINPFIKYGCVKENDFYEKVKDIIIYKDLNNKYLSLQEYLDSVKEKHENQVFYVTDEVQQSQYIKMFKENEMNAIFLNAVIDNHFMSFLESKESNIKFKRIDSDISDSLKNDDDKEEDKDLKESLEKLFKETIGKEKLKIQVESLKSETTAAMILVSEESRRMYDMSKMWSSMGMGAGADMFQVEETLVLNKNSKLINLILKLSNSGDNSDDLKLICEEVYDLALIGNKQLTADELSKFTERSNNLIVKLLDKFIN